MLLIHEQTAPLLQLYSYIPKPIVSCNGCGLFRDIQHKDLENTPFDLNWITAIRPCQFSRISRMWNLKLTKLADPPTYRHSGVPPSVTNSGPVLEI